MMASSSCVDAVGVGGCALPLDIGRKSLPEAATFSMASMEAVVGLMWKEYLMPPVGKDSLDKTCGQLTSFAASEDYVYDHALLG
jgi:hypothetical protein